MAASRVPAALRTRLGDDATFGLIELLDTERTDWSEQVLSVAADRFERRLSEEISTLRIEFREALHSGLGSLRQDMNDGRASVRQEMNDGFDSLRQEMNTSFASDRENSSREALSVRQLINDGLTAVRQELATTRTEMLKWSFLFWVGQIATIAGLLAFMLRGVK